MDGENDNLYGTSRYVAPTVGDDGIALNSSFNGPVNYNSLNSYFNGTGGYLPGGGGMWGKDPTNGDRTGNFAYHDGNIEQTMPLPYGTTVQRWNTYHPDGTMTSREEGGFGENGWLDNHMEQITFAALAAMGGAAAGAAMGGGAAATGAGTGEGIGTMGGTMGSAGDYGLASGYAGAGADAGAYGAYAGGTGAGALDVSGAGLDQYGGTYTAGDGGAGYAGSGGASVSPTGASPYTLENGMKVAKYGSALSSMAGGGGNGGGTGTGSGGGGSNGGGGFFGGDSGNGGINWGGLFGSLYDKKTADQNSEALKGTLDSLSNMYTPGSPEANLMQRQMEAKDAAAGRNSQYGPRAVDLAGKLADARMRTLSSPGYMNLQAAYLNQNRQGYGQLLSQLNGGSLGNLFGGSGSNGGLINQGINSGLGSLYKYFTNGSSGPSPSATSGGMVNSTNDLGAGMDQYGGGYTGADPNPQFTDNTNDWTF